VSALKMAGLGLTQTPRLGDVAPSVRPSGKAGELGAVMGNQGLQPDVVVETPRTPELGECRSRHRQRTKHGEITRTWGQHGMKIPEPGPGYGIKSNKGEDVARNFKAGQQLGVAEYMASCGEAIYKSTIQEPLGKSWVRGHALPPRTKEAEFPGFGIKSCAQEPAKECIWPRGYESESLEAKEIYRRTHGSTDPGEMSRRDYVWPQSVTGNPHFRFGAVDTTAGPNNGQGAKSALTMDTGDEVHTVPNSRIVKDTLEHFREVAVEHLGKSRSLLQGIPPLPKGHTYGMKSGHDVTNAGALIRGSYGERDQVADADLGCCTARGRRNFVTKMPLGVPSIRYDLVPPPMERRSIANSVNFGDEFDARGLIFPGKFQHQGVNDGDFQHRRSKDELRGIIEGAGYALDAADYHIVFEAAAELHGDGEPFASVQAFMYAYSDWAADCEAARR